MKRLGGTKMNIRNLASERLAPQTRRLFAAVALLALVQSIGTAPAVAQKAYITNTGGPAGTVSVIDTTTDTVIGSPIPVGAGPFGLAVTPDAGKVYVANVNSNSVSSIATATNTVTTIPVGNHPEGGAITPDGSKAYVTNNNFGSSDPAGFTVSVIATASNSVIATVRVGRNPLGVAASPDGSKVYVGNGVDNTVSVIDTTTNTVIGSPIPVGPGEFLGWR
jgi:YVTN family beta-propeller protein